MDKKEIYEHLAKIYLDASLKRRNKNKDYLRVSHNPPFFISLVVISGLTIFLFANHGMKNRFLVNSQTALTLQPLVTKIDFNFNPARKETYSLDLNNLDLSNFKILQFSLKKVDYSDNIYIKVQLMNSLEEKSGLYLKNISHKLRDYKINLSEFKNINDWSRMVNLSFIVEEWNLKEKHGMVYIDNIAFLR